MSCRKTELPGRLKNGLCKGHKTRSPPEDQKTRTGFYWRLRSWETRERVRGINTGSYIGMKTHDGVIANSQRCTH